ncbi:hypothetical protein [Pseudoprimorskyibacter insulae]|uniref:Sulfotransferase domain-containing protein n=1 Tax=Pseudoprimorskyibacter insulae TaxID=1695997 RepID=A0A2R8B0P8_9RHOB|nr:hypothetical protein [Pseudoprimorskyibacter insulae]SPF81810.1 hypothetical protein PRI8871_03635 [Pseudoprimorskyibacter insulae]
MSKVILHIGTHKTATTTLQDMLWENSALLAEHGVVYPRLNKHTGHHGLVLNWDGRPKVYELPKGSMGTLEELAAAHAEGNQTLLLSSEEFSRNRSLSEMDKIRDALSAFDEIEVICVLRTQWQFLQSVYLEVSKSRIPPRPPELVAPIIDSGTIEGLWVDYNGLLDCLEATFKPEQITLMDFDSCRKAEGGIIGSFLRHMGVDLTVDQLEVVNEGMSNASPMSLASWAGNILSEPYAAPDWLVAMATEAMRAEFGDKVKPCLFTREEFRALKDHYDTRNEDLRKRRAPYQPDFKLTPATPDGLTLFRNEVPSSFWVRMGRRMAYEMRHA